MGRLLGSRLLLRHAGRVSGLDHRAVLDVVECVPGGGMWVVASRFGADADWYRNLRAQPKTVIQVGSRHYAVTAHFLTPGEGADVMEGHARRRPRAARRLCSFLNIPCDGTESGFREAGRAISFVRLDTDGGHRRR
ncbi:nitroreductase family deazaflavin-dependent oxidoreductase [Streptomyces sp. NPDC004646]